MTADELLAEIYNLRMVVLIEEEPQSNSYRQVIFNKDQFHKVSDAVADTVKIEVRGNLEILDFKMSEQTMELPEWVRDFS